MPAVLQELMRHKDINTTMKFYVTTNAESTADDLWKAESPNTFPNTRTNSAVEANS